MQQVRNLMTLGTFLHYYATILFFLFRLMYMENGFWVKNKKRLTRQYVTEGPFRYDVFALMPLELFYLWLGVDATYLRLPRMMKVIGKQTGNCLRLILKSTSGFPCSLLGVHRAPRLDHGQAVHAADLQDRYLHAVPDPLERLRLLRHLGMGGHWQERFRLQRGGERLYPLLLLRN